MTALRLLHFIPTLGGGGAERQITYLAKGLVARGVDVHVASVHGGPNLERLTASGAMRHAFSRSGRYTPATLLAAVGLIRRLRPDIVQTWLTPMDLIAGVAATITRTPWVLSERSSLAAYPPAARHTARRMVGKFAAAIVANSPDGLQFWEPVRVRKFVVPNAVPFEDLDAVPPWNGEGGQRKLIVFAGRLEAEKNLPNLIGALDRVMARRDAVALLCGSGPMEDEVRRRIAATSRPDRIRLMGFAENLPALMKRADALVAVSVFEGRPNVVLEAIACGAPLVVSDIPAHRVFLDDTSAVFAAAGDPAAIAAAIDRTLDDAAAARERARLARRVIAHWTIDRVADQYIAIYEELLGRRAG